MFLNKGANVLSLFDGKSSGRTACDLAGNGWTDEVIAHNLRHSRLCHANT